MTTKELAIDFIRGVYKSQQIEDLYQFTTQKTIFYSLNTHENIDFVSLVNIIRQYDFGEYELLESKVCCKFVLNNKGKKLSLYFENIKSNRLTRVELYEEIV